MVFSISLLKNEKKFQLLWSPYIVSIKRRIFKRVCQEICLSHCTLIYLNFLLQVRILGFLALRIRFCHSSGIVQFEFIFTCKLSRYYSRTIMNCMSLTLVGWATHVDKTAYISINFIKILNSGSQIMKSFLPNW